MSRHSSIIFKPVFGCRYIITNKNGDTTIGRVLGANDKKLYGDIRSPRKCERGTEFFKVLIGDKVIKMMNSNQNKSCVSDDGVWIFTGDRPVDAPKLTEQTVKKPRLKKKKIESSHIEFINTSFQSLVSN